MYLNGSKMTILFPVNSDIDFKTKDIMKNTYINKIIHRAALPTILSVLMFILSSCYYHVQITPEDEFYVDKKNDIWYAVSSVSYEPVSVGEEYGEITSDGTILYRIGNTDPKIYLTEEYNGIGMIFYNRDYKLPTLSEFEADAAYVCRGETQTLCILEIHEADMIDQIVNIMLSGEQTYTPTNIENSYSMKLASSENPDIYYTIRYIIAADGTRYLQDRGEKICVNAGDLLSDKLMSAAEEAKTLEEAQSGVKITLAENE